MDKTKLGLKDIFCIIKYVKDPILEIIAGFYIIVALSILFILACRILVCMSLYLILPNWYYTPIVDDIRDLINQIRLNLNICMLLAVIAIIPAIIAKYRIKKNSDVYIKKIAFAKDAEKWKMRYRQRQRWERRQRLNK